MSKRSLSLSLVLVLTATAMAQFDAKPIVMRKTFDRDVPRQDVTLDSLPTATASVDAETGFIRRIDGRIAVDGARTPREAADGFLKSNSQALGLSPALSELQVEREFDSLTGHHVIYRQVYNGLPVFGGELGVHIGQDNSILTVNSDLKPISTPSLFPNIVGLGGALTSALNAVPVHDPSHSLPQTQAGVLVQAGVPVPAWRVTFRTYRPGAVWEVFVNAATNRVIQLRNIAEYASGSGMVYDPNPVATSGIAGLVDDGSMESVLNAQRKSVTLLGLDGSGYLQGTYVTTAPSGSISRAHQTSEVFSYVHGDTGFHETMCYYHVDAIERYIQSLGFTNIQNRQVGVDVDGLMDDNSYYDPSTGDVVFGIGGVPDPEDADVIWHENGHAIQHNQVPGWGELEQGGAMGEGWGDYWAGSHGAGIGPKSPAWDVYTFKWDATAYNPGNPAYLRRLDSTKHFPLDADGDVHDDGEMWSASLWQIRKVVGKTRADKMILESHFYLSPSAQFVDGCNAILKANRLLYADANRSDIATVFVNRGFLKNTVLNSLKLSATSVTSGTPVTGTISVGPAPAVSTSIAISHTSGVSVAKSVTVPSGSISVNLPVTTLAVTSQTVSTITVSYGGISASASLTIKPVPVLSSFKLNASNVIAGTPVIGTASLNMAAAASTTLSMSHTAGTSVQLHPVISAGKTSVSIGVTPLNVTSKTVSTITASYNGKSFSASLTITPGPVLSSLTASVSEIKGGASLTGTVKISTPAPAGGTAIYLSSNSSSVAVHSPLTVPQGATSAVFSIRTLSVSTKAAATVTATRAGVVKSVTITINP